MPPPKLPIEKIDRLANALARPGKDFTVAPPANYIFWLGAGFSRTAGIPLAEEVVDRLLDKRWRPAAGGSKLQSLCQLTPEEQIKRQKIIRQWATDQKLLTGEPVSDWGELYGKCLHLLPGEVDRQEFIIECIEEGRGRLNMAHLLLGQLIKNGFINTLFTTNFDDLILRSLQLYFEVPSVLDPDSTNTLLTNSRFVQVGYLHGRLASYRQRHTGSEVKDSIPGFESYLAQVLKDHGLVVIGYRGGDETPMMLLHKVLMERGSGPGRGLFWVTREDNAKALPTSVREILELKDCYWLPGWDADDFMKQLCAWKGIGLGIPSPTEWIKGMEDMLPSEAKKLLAEFQRETSFDFSKKSTIEPDELVLESEPPWFTTAKQLLEQKPQEALDVLDKAKPASEESVDALQLWFTAFENLKKPKDAIAVARKAIEHFPDDGWAHHMLGRGFFIDGQWDKALAEYRRSLELGSDPVWLKRCIGVTLNFAGRLSEAEEALRDALKEAKTTQERSQVLPWLAENAHSLGRHAEAIALFEEAAKYRAPYNWDYYIWGEALKALGRNEEAAEKFKLYEAGAQKKPDGGK